MKPALVAFLIVAHLTVGMGPAFDAHAATAVDGGAAFGSTRGKWENVYP